MSAAPLVPARDGIKDCEGLQRFPGCCGGVQDEIRRRVPYCLKDYTTAFTFWSKTLSATLFMFFATMFSTVALGVIIDKLTDGRIGLSEYLAVCSAAGLAHAVLGAQPLLVLRPTGPITAIVLKLSQLADLLTLDFYRLLGATGFFVALLMVLAAAFELPRHIFRLTTFTHDVFACFVCSIYVHDGVTDVLQRMDADRELGPWLLNFNLAILTLAVALILHGARGWRTLTAPLRSLLDDYAVTIAVLFASAASYAVAGDPEANVRRITLPDRFGPTCVLEDTLEAHGNASSTPTPRCVQGSGYESSWERRAWLVSFDGTSVELWLVAAACAVPITFFFYMDQNISSRLCQLPSLKLSRGHYYNVSFLLIGLFNAVGPAFGLPFVTGSLPHSPQLVRALTRAGGSTTSSDRPAATTGVAGDEAAVEKAIAVAESRVAPLLVYLCIGIPLFVPHNLALGWMPEAAISGVLVYVGLEGIFVTQLWKRVLLLITDPSAFPPAEARIGARRVHLYTLVQLLCLALCWAVNLSPAGLCVSFVVVSLVPLREKVLPRLFTPYDLTTLDAPHPDETAEAP